MSQTTRGQSQNQGSLGGSQWLPELPKKEQEVLSFPLSPFPPLFRFFIVSTALGLTHITVVGLTAVLCWVTWLSWDPLPEEGDWWKGQKTCHKWGGSPYCPEKYFNSGLTAALLLPLDLRMMFFDSGECGQGLRLPGSPLLLHPLWVWNSPRSFRSFSHQANSSKWIYPSRVHCVSHVW